jgi:enoyl-CoA hydratase/carnithine racemase
MLLTGRVVTAEEALDWGVVARVVPHERVQEEAREALRQVCKTAPGARATVKRTMDLFYGAYDRMGMEESLRLGEYEEGYRAFKERRPPSWIPDDLVDDDGRL